MVEKIEYPTTANMRIIFGDWCMATLRGVKVDKPNGKIIFVFIPDDFMRWFHQIQDKDYDEQYFVIKKEYPEEYCHLVNKDPKYQAWMLFCDYDGKHCDPTIGINYELTTKNKSLKSERDAIDESFLLYRLKTKRIISHPEEFKEEAIKEFVKQKVITRPEYLDVPAKEGVKKNE